MPNGLPFVFMRRRKVVEDGVERRVVSYVVILSRCYDYRHYASSWMDNPVLGASATDDDMVFVPDVDLTEQCFVFDGPDPEQEERKAMAKMKELMASMEV